MISDGCIARCGNNIELGEMKNTDIHITYRLDRGSGNNIGFYANRPAGQEFYSGNKFKIELECP